MRGLHDENGFAIEVDKAGLLAKLEENRANHHAAFLEAKEAYRVVATAALNALIDEVANGRITRLHIQAPIPEEHTADYDRVIGMLKMDRRDVVPLTEQQYSQYVLDEWGWRSQFLANTMAYVGEGALGASIN